MDVPATAPGCIQIIPIRGGGRESFDPNTYYQEFGWLRVALEDTTTKANEKGYRRGERGAGVKKVLSLATIGSHEMVGGSSRKKSEKKSWGGRQNWNNLTIRLLESTACIKTGICFDGSRWR